MQTPRRTSSPKVQGKFSAGVSFWASFTLALTLSISMSVSACFAGNSETLSKLEKWLFFASFADQPEETRIKRLEEKVFGDPCEGTLDERLNKLDQVLTEQQKDKAGSGASGTAGTSSSNSGNNNNSGASGNSSSTASPDSVSGNPNNASGGAGETPDWAGNTGGSGTASPPIPLSENQIPDFPTASKSTDLNAGTKPVKQAKVKKGGKKGSKETGPEAMAQLPGAGFGSAGGAGQMPVRPAQTTSAPGFNGQANPGQGFAQGSRYSPQQNTAGRPPIQSPYAQAQSYPAPQVKAPVAGYDAQKIAVQAAREQEMQDLLKEGARLWRNRHGVEAVEKFDQVLRLDPQNAEAHFSIGVIQESAGKLNEALEHYQKARKTNPDNKDFDDAVDAIYKRLQAQSRPSASPATGLTGQATAAYKRGEYFSALDLFKQADAKTPNQALIKHNIGSCYLMLKDFFNAQEFFKQAKDLDPTNEKFVRAFNELSAEIQKNQSATQEIEREYGGSGSGSSGNASANSAPKSGIGKTPKAGNAKQQIGKGNQQGGNGNPQAGYGNQQTGNGNPQTGYGNQQAGYGNQQTGYGNQQAGYGNQQAGYGNQQAGYGNQQAGYGNQQAGYGNPQAGYGNPQAGYGNQQAGYGNQQAGYGNPQAGYGSAQPAYGNQQTGYSNPPRAYGNPQSGSGMLPPQATPQSGYSNPPASATFSERDSRSQDMMVNFGIKGKASDEGIQVTGIRSGSRAAQAGLLVGDVIRTVDGNEVMQPNQMNKVLGEINSTQKFPLLIFRNGNIQPIQF